MQGINVNILMEEYQNKINELTKMEIMNNAYIKQLEEMVKNLQKQLDEATTVVESE